MSCKSCHGTGYAIKTGRLSEMGRAIIERKTTPVPDLGNLDLGKMAPWIQMKTKEMGARKWLESEAALPSATSDPDAWGRFVFWLLADLDLHKKHERSSASFCTECRKGLSRRQGAEKKKKDKADRAGQFVPLKDSSLFPEGGKL